MIADATANSRRKNRKVLTSSDIIAPYFCCFGLPMLFSNASRFCERWSLSVRSFYVIR